MAITVRRERTAWQRVGDNFRAALLAISAYALPLRDHEPSLDDPSVEAARARIGGQLTLQPLTRTRWYPEHLEAAEWQADAGNLLEAGRLARAMERDGVLQGLLATRCGGLVKLPKRFRGPADMVDRLQSGGAQARSVFDEMLPPSELEAFTSDFVKLGVAVGELVPVEGRDFPLFVRRSPEYLVFRYSENQWFFQSAVGLIPITPGDGRWVLLLGGREMPWQRGLWRALGRAYVRKEHACLARDNWERTLANPARVGTAPQGATGSEIASWFRKVAAWGFNTVFALKPGWDVKLLESKGEGYQSFSSTIKEQNEEYQFLLHGQVVTSTGGVGFANADVFDDVRADLVQRDGDAVAHVINTQVLPAWTLNTYGEERFGESPTFAWDTTPPSDLAAIANTYAQAAGAINALRDALAVYGRELDIDAVISRFGIPTKVGEVAEGLRRASPANEAIEATDAAAVRGSRALSRRLQLVRTEAA